jgi:pentatricopeptide repeat protein
LFDLLYIFKQQKYQSKFTSADSWAAIIQGCRINKRTNEAWELFQEMERDQVVPNEITFSTILSILAEMTNLHEGQRIYRQLMVS